MSSLTSWHLREQISELELKNRELKKRINELETQLKNMDEFTKKCFNVS